MANEIIKQEYVNGFFVSTVRLGYDTYEDIPYETMVFKADNNDRVVHWGELWGERCSIFQEAIVQHQTAVDWAKAQNRSEMDDFCWRVKNEYVSKEEIIAEIERLRKTLDEALRLGALGAIVTKKWDK